MKAVASIGLQLETLKITNRHRGDQYVDDIKTLVQAELHTSAYLTHYRSIRAHDRYDRVIIAICGGMFTLAWCF